MLIGCAKTVTAVLIGVTFAHAQSCNVSPEEAVRVFGLSDEFGSDVSVTPFDDDVSFPWWIRNAESAPVAVIEAIYLDETGAEPSLMLDAQYLDGDDFIASSPVTTQAARSWRCER